MKITNLKYITDSLTDSEGVVEVTTGILWWKKTKVRFVRRHWISWYFKDTGEFTPDRQLEKLARIEPKVFVQ